MTYKKVVAFGDSFVWGDELLDPALVDREDAHPCIIENTEYRESNCFVGRIAEHYNVPSENFGIPGGSLQSTIWTYLWWLENETVPLEDCLVLVGLTGPERQSFFNPKHISYSNDPAWNRFVHGAWVHNNASIFDDDWVDMVKKHTLLTYSRRYFQLNLTQALTFFDNARHNHAHLLQFFTISNRSTINRTYPTLPSDSSCVDLLKDIHLQNVLKPNRHPNEKGHTYIKNWLLSLIDML